MFIYLASKSCIINYIVVTFYEVHSVIEAFMLTFAVTSALTVYTLQSKRDFSSMRAGYVIHVFYCTIYMNRHVVVHVKKINIAKFCLYT